MKNWYECKLKMIVVDEQGIERKAKKHILVDAISYTDAEARTIEIAKTLTSNAFSIVSIKPSNISQVLTDGEAKNYYKSRITTLSIDETTGKQKGIKEYVLVLANDPDQAIRVIESGLSYILVPYAIDSVAISTIADVFPYEKSKHP